MSDLPPLKIEPKVTPVLYMCAKCNYPLLAMDQFIPFIGHIDVMCPRCKFHCMTKTDFSIFKYEFGCDCPQETKEDLK